MTESACIGRRIVFHTNPTSINNFKTLSFLHSSSSLSHLHFCSVLFSLSATMSRHRRQASQVLPPEIFTGTNDVTNFFDLKQVGGNQGGENKTTTTNHQEEEKNSVATPSPATTCKKPPPPGKSAWLVRCAVWSNGVWESMTICVYASFCVSRMKVKGFFLIWFLFFCFSNNNNCDIMGMGIHGLRKGDTSVNLYVTFYTRSYFQHPLFNNSFNIFIQIKNKSIFIILVFTFLLIRLLILPKKIIALLTLLFFEVLDFKWSLNLTIVKIQDSISFIDYDSIFYLIFIYNL